MRLLIFIGLFFIKSSTYSQTLLDWPDLAKGMVLESVIPNELTFEFQKANFSDTMTALDGKEVMLTGYFLVLDGARSRFLLSKNPLASCFFCGNGGPETVVELSFSKAPDYNVDDLIFVRGILRLNEDDPNYCYYTLEEADAFSID